MTVTISRLYDNYADAQRAVTRLEAAGLPQADLSIVANNSDNWYGADKKVDRDRDGTDDRAEGAATGAGIGAGIGGVAGLLAGLGLLAIPGYLSTQEMKQAIGTDVLTQLEQQTGLSQEELLARLSRELPTAVDKYTPNGRLPDAAA